MRVNEADAVAEGGELDDHVPQQGGLAGAGLADDIGVLAEIGQGDAERDGLAPGVARADVEDVIVHGCGFSRQPPPEQKFPGGGRNL